MMTLAAPLAEPIPLDQGQDGVIRVGGTRVTLDTVIAAFHAGATPEEITQDYPLRLDDVYAAVTYFLRHRDEVEGYLAARRKQAESVKQQVLARGHQEGLRQRLMARMS